MLIKYIGPHAAITIRHPVKLVFDVGVPTYIHDGLYNFLDKKVFKPCKAKGEKGRPVWIDYRLNNVSDRITASFVKDHIQACFPTCEIVFTEPKNIIPYRHIRWDPRKHPSFHNTITISTNTSVNMLLQANGLPSCPYEIIQTKSKGRGILTIIDDNDWSDFPRFSSKISLDMLTLNDMVKREKIILFSTDYLYETLLSGRQIFCLTDKINVTKPILNLAKKHKVIFFRREKENIERMIHAIKS